MKRLIVAGVLLIAIVAICITGIVIINGYCAEMSDLLQQANDYYEDDDMESVARVSEEIETRWVEIEPYISFFVNHDKVDDIGVSISRLKPLALTGNRQDYLAECRLAEVKLLHLKNDEKLDFLNVF